MDHGANVAVQTKNGWTALHCLTSRLVECGAIDCAQTKNRWTSKHFNKGNLNSTVAFVEVATLLIEQEANVTATTKNGWTPLHCLTNRLFECNRDATLTIARLLLDRWPNGKVNAQTEAGSTALHLLIDNLNKDNHAPALLEMVKLLFQYDAHATVEDKDGWTPLHCLTRRLDKGFLDTTVAVAKLLMENGAEVQAYSETVPAAVHLLANNINKGNHEGTVTLIKLLLEYHDVEVETRDTWTPLHCLTSRLDEDNLEAMLALATLFLEHWAEAVALKQQATTALRLLTTNLNRENKEGTVAMIRLLLKHGVSVTGQRKDRWVECPALPHKET